MGDNYYNKKRLNNAIKKYLQQNQNNKNKIQFIEFIKHLAAKDISPSRQLKYFYNLKILITKINKPFNEITKKDIEEIVIWINDSYNNFWTKRDFKIELKIFFRWIKEGQGLEFQKHEYPKEVRWISTGKKNNQRKLPKDMLTSDEIKELANHTNNLRDRAFILSLYETGARIGELLDVKIKDVEFDRYGSLINLNGKTGPRKIRILASSPAISNWLMEHPKRTDREAPLFSGIWSKKRGKPIGYQTYRKMLREVAEKTGLKKPVNPHNFRHSRSTELAKMFTESQLCEYLGWIQGSKEAVTYVHLSGRDMDTAVLRMHGIIDKVEEEKNRFRMITCPRCNTKNSPGGKFCSNCSLGLDLKAVKNFEETKDDLNTNILNIFQDKELALQTLDALTKLIQKQ